MRQRRLLIAALAVLVCPEGNPRGSGEGIVVARGDDRGYVRLQIDAVEFAELAREHDLRTSRTPGRVCERTRVEARGLRKRFAGFGVSGRRRHRRDRAPGPGAIGVEQKPAVYLVWWGPQWKSGFTTPDTNGVMYSSKTLRTYLQSLLETVLRP